MLVDRLQPDSVPPPTQVSPPPSSSVQSPQTPQPAEKPRSDDPSAGADQVLFSEKNAGKLKVIRHQNERQNDEAGAIRESDRAAALLSQKLDQAKAPLEAIVKNFPPFSPEDKERLELLRSYTSLRKEIDQLTFPPPPSVVQVHQEVALPAPLTMSADDSQIADHIDKLDAASAGLETFRSGMAADTAAFVADGRFYSIFSAPKTGETAASAPAQTESAAAEKSAEVGRQFASSVAQGVTAQYPQFLKGLS